MSTTSRPALRWAVPAGLAAVVLGGAVLGPALSASAGVDLPDRTPDQLLTDLQTARVDAFAGTVAHHADLGLPSLPSGLGGGHHSTDAASLLDGSHTLRVWAAGDAARVSLHGEMGELTVVTDGDELWTWSSDEQTATRVTLPEHGADDGAPARRAMPTATPEAVTDAVLAALEPSTVVSVGPHVSVAGRPARTLVLEPSEPGSLVGSIRIAVDAAESVPTRVQVFPAGSQDAALDVGFTSLTFEAPDPDLFTFAPPPGATVRSVSPDGHGRPGSDPSAYADGTEGPDGPTPGVARVGSGWSTVTVARVPAGALDGTALDGTVLDGAVLDGSGLDDTGLGAPAGDAAAEDVAALLEALPRVTGDGWTGRLLTSRLFSVLVTDDGRVLAGAVDGDALVDAAAQPAAELG